MNSEEYIANGYKACDYEKLNHWQRLRVFVVNTKKFHQWYKYRGISKYHWVSYIGIHLHVYPWSVWRLGIFTSQEYDYFSLGPLEISISIY